MFFQMLCCVRVVYSNDAPVRPPHETRCMSCAYRNEGPSVRLLISFYLYVYVCICICVSVCLSLCGYVYVCIYIYIVCVFVWLVALC